MDFAPIVRKHFKFLEDSYGFSLANEDKWEIEYETSKVYVNVNIAWNRGRNINVWFRLKNDHPIYAGTGIDLNDVLHYKEVLPVGTFLPTAARDEKVAESITIELADLVLKHGHEVLIGDHDFYQSLRMLISEKAIQYSKEKELSFLKQKVKKSWREKDYANVYYLLNSIRESLKPSEVKKMNYAFKQMGSAKE